MHAGIGVCIPSERRAVSLPSRHTPVVTRQVAKLIGSSHQAVLGGVSKPTAACKPRSTGACMDSQQLQSHWSHRGGCHGIKTTRTNPTASCLCSLPRDRWHGHMGQGGEVVHAPVTLWSILEDLSKPSDGPGILLEPGCPRPAPAVLGAEEMRAACFCHPSLKRCRGLRLGLVSGWRKQNMNCLTGGNFCLGGLGICPPSSSTSPETQTEPLGIWPGRFGGNTHSPL